MNSKKDSIYFKIHKLFQNSGVFTSVQNKPEEKMLTEQSSIAKKEAMGVVINYLTPTPY